jgi:predicted enzyme related to lactoylglutathione lyase
MPERTSYEPSTPSWVDLGEADVDAGWDFYSSLFGWQYEDMGPDAGGYRMATLKGKYVAGFGPAQNPGPPFWSTYVSVTDADDTAAKVKDAGGNVIVEPMDVFDSGRMAVFQDAEGAFISVWQPKAHIGAQLVNEHGTLNWNELNTRDLAKAKAFYKAVFGWDAKTSEAPGGDYTEWKLGDRSIGGCLVMGDNFPPEVPPNWLVYFAVDDVNAMVAKANGLGATTIMPPMDVPVGTFSVLSDPQGAVFAIIQLSGPVS